MARTRMALTVAAIGVAALLGGGHTPAEAAPMSPSPLAMLAQQVTIDGAETVHYPYRYCRRWRVRCANRYGWHTPRFRRCLRRHAC